jgi:hypothetical protein
MGLMGKLGLFLIKGQRAFVQKPGLSFPLWLGAGLVGINHAD